MTEKRIDIRWRDLDGLGHVNQAVYQTYGEEIVDAWFRDVLDLPKGEVWDYVVVRLTTDYRSELRLADGQVTGTVRVVRLGTSSLTLALELRAVSDGRVAAETEVVFACWDREQRTARPISDEERAKIGGGGMSFDGTSIQNAIYISGESEWPVAAAEWEALAEEKLDPGAFGYIAGGAGSEATMRANREAFERRRIKPRMLTGNTQRDLSVEVLGTQSPAPFLLAPIGVLSIAHEEGEMAVARAAAALGLPFCLSTAASSTIEDIAEAMGGAPRWFQLYWINDRDIVASLLSRAGLNGFSAVVVTLDTPILGWRPRDLRRAYLPFIKGEGCAQYFSDPVFRERLAKPPEEDLLTAAATMLSTFPHLALTWDDLSWLRELTDLPLLVKGILTAEDAQRAFSAGVDGIIVSNHGGRQVDGAVAALDALVDVRAGVGDDATVLMDGGIRHGADVVKAMALGADAVLVGRPYAYGLAVGGQQGVEAVLQQLWAETDITMALAGLSSVRELDGSILDQI